MKRLRSCWDQYASTHVKRTWSHTALRVAMATALWSAAQAGRWSSTASVTSLISSHSRWTQKQMLVSLLQAQRGERGDMTTHETYAVCQKTHAYYGRSCECRDFSCDQYQGLQGVGNTLFSMCHMFQEVLISHVLFRVLLPGNDKCVCRVCTCLILWSSFWMSPQPGSCLSLGGQICAEGTVTAALQAKLEILVPPAPTSASCTATMTRWPGPRPTYWILTSLSSLTSLYCFHAEASFPQSTHHVQGLLTRLESSGVWDEVCPPEPHSGGSGWRLSNSNPLFRPSCGGGRLLSALPAETWTKGRLHPCPCSSSTRWVSGFFHDCTNTSTKIEQFSNLC